MSERRYEALIILKNPGTDQELARATARLEGLIKKVSGSVDGSQSLGRRRLAFRIARQTEGHYQLIRFTAPTGRIGELERLLRLDEGIVRFMIVSEDQEAAAESAQPAATTQSESSSVQSTATEG